MIGSSTARRVTAPSAAEQGQNRSGSVSRVLSPRTLRAGAVTISLGRRLPAASGSRPGSGCETGRLAPSRNSQGIPRRSSSCLALLPMGFTEPGRSPGLLVSSYLTVSPLPTAPARRQGPQAVCFLWHFPWPRGRWVLPTIEPCGARTFLPLSAGMRSVPLRRPGQPAITRSTPILTALSYATSRLNAGISSGCFCLTARKPSIRV